MRKHVETAHMHRRPGFLAALVAALCLTAPAAAFAGPDLTTSVSGSPNPVAAGQYVSLQIVTDNVGDQTAHDVIAKAFIPAKTMYIPGDSDCTKVGNEVRCTIGDLPAGGNTVNEVVLRLLDFSFAGYIQAFVTSHTSDADGDHSNDGSHTNITVYNHSHDHQLGGVQKKEEHVSMPAFSGIVERKLNCDPGYVAVDGGFRLDNVDQDTGTAKSVSLLASYADGDGYTFKLVNYATGQAQGKIFGVCLPKTTQGANADNSGPHHTHNVVIGAPKTVTQTVVGGQHHNVKVSCDAGPGDYVVAVAPGYGVSGAEGYLTYSMPGYDANGRPAWDFGFTATQSGDVEFSIRCLDRWLSTSAGHSHELWFSHVDKWFDVEPNHPYGTYDLDCSDEAKGIVAGWDLEDPLYMIGGDPQPKRRSFRILNDSDSTKKAHLFLLCLGDRSGTDPPPPVAPASVSKVAKSNATGARVALTLSCPARGCGGTVDLVASSTGTRAVAAAAGKVIGRATFKGGKGRLKVRVTILKKYRGAVRSGKLGSVTAVVRKHNGKVAKRQKLSLR